MKTNSKSYLSDQIRLMSLTTNDLFTDEEYDLYMKIIGCINEINSEEDAANRNEKHDPTIRLNKIDEKREYQRKLSKMIDSHAGKPRVVQVRRLFDTRRLKRDEDDNIIYPEGISWSTLRTSKKITEFVSDASRAMGLKPNDITYDKIIIKWKSPDILKQIVLDGFIMPVQMPDGTVEQKKYMFLTASAGQLRTDRMCVMDEKMWDKIKGRLMCGLTFDKINSKGGINVNKLLAYIALSFSATDPWPEMDIAKSIVVDDFEAPVRGLTDYINHDYEMDRGVHETSIKHTDGAGMMLPKVSRKNFMVRAPWIKGLLCSFDYLKFCTYNDVEPVLTDIYGKKHDLVKEDIQIIFFKSQFKLYKYYDSWDEYIRMFKENGCTLNRTNFEEDYIQDTTISYQMLQTLTGMTDEEIYQFTKKTHDRILALCHDTKAMLTALQADEDSDRSHKKALALYPELLRECYFRDMLKAIKLKWIQDAKSGRIKCENKRLFAVPDLYAACEYLFLGIKEPNGLLKDGEVACKTYRMKEKVDLLRSPHLYAEHAIRKIVQDQDVYNWFYTDGVYTSCKDLISKILQFK